ncbi:MAG: exosortase/archaeosortase family protein [Terriglobales bacterium]
MKKSGVWSFSALWAISLVVAWRPLVATFSLAWRDNQYTHILLILPVSAALIYVEWPALKSMSAPGLRAGTVLLIVSLLAACMLKWFLAGLQPDLRVSIAMLAVVLWWIGAFVFSFGTRVSRSLMFPLCFLFWLVPFPQVMLNAIVSFLQQESAVAADMLFSIAGVPVARDGVLLAIPGLTVQVAEECSSIRSSLMLLVTTMVLAQISLRSPWKKVLVIAVAVPLSVAKNALRIFTIAMLGTRVDPSFLTGRFHHQGGIVFFLFSLLAVFVLLWILRRTEPDLLRTPQFRPAQP